MLSLLHAQLGGFCPVDPEVRVLSRLRDWIPLVAAVVGIGFVLGWVDIYWNWEWKDTSVLNTFP